MTEKRVLQRFLKFIISPLPFLLAANIVASALHYGHNVAFIADYFESVSWRVPLIVIWIIITVYAIIGYALVKRGKAVCGYLLPRALRRSRPQHADALPQLPAVRFSWQINASILLYSVYAFTLLVHATWSLLRIARQRS